MEEIGVISILEFLGALVRFSIMFIYKRLTKQVYNTFNYYLESKSLETIGLVSNHYYNGIVGFITVVFLIFVAYVFLGK